MDTSEPPGPDDRPAARQRAVAIGGVAQQVTDTGIRRDVRRALAHHLGLDIPAAEDGAA